MLRQLQKVIVVSMVWILALSGVVAVRAQETPQAPIATPPPSTAPAQIGLRGEGQVDGTRIRLEVQPGESREGMILLGNSGTEPLRLVTFTGNTVPKVNGGLSMRPEGEEHQGATAWVTYPTEEITLEPGAEQAKAFSVSVPDGIEPGEYVVPIAAETLDSFAVGGSPNFRQKIRKIIAVYIVIPGDYEASFELGSPQIVYGEQGPAIEIPLTNTGGTSLRLLGSIELTNAVGDVVVDSQAAMGTLYLGQESMFRKQLSGVLEPGAYSLSFTMSDQETEYTNGFENVQVEAPEPPSNEIVPLAFSSVLILPNADTIQFASVAVEIQNNAKSERSTRLTLVVTKDGKPLEEFPLAENLALPQGTTTISQRYLPMTGWEPGSYAFSLRLEAIDPGTGGATLLLSAEDVSRIEVP